MNFPYDWVMRILFTLGFLGTIWQIALRYLQFYQQEEYDTNRFLAWWFRQKAVEKRASLACILLGLFFFFLPPQAQPALLLSCLVVLVPLCALGWSNRPRESKKPLAPTKRVKRILGLTAVLQITLLHAILAVSSNTYPHAIPVFCLLCLLWIQATPLFLAAANGLLWPLERSIQHAFLNEARKKLYNYNPYTIGITGSYGKTSIKHILDHILTSQTHTLATPGSVNTQMGITRIVRERLKKEHQYFIVEMGAYGIGSIKTLCDLTPPRAALVTAVGLAHYERFKSVETVKTAKAELVDALPKDGFAVLNGDDPNVRAMAEITEASIGFYGRNTHAGSLHCRLVSDTLTPNGMECTLNYENRDYTFTLPLYGRHQALNAAGAFLLACRLGTAPVSAIAALQTVPPINHRLVVQKSLDGIIMIDDAYNSNPEGFKNALEVLEILPGKPKVLVTPGMVELGERMNAEHENLAPLAARCSDIICLVAAHRISAFREALLQIGFPVENLYTFATLNEARSWLRENITSGGVILFENDLPDLYETGTAFPLI